MKERRFFKINQRDGGVDGSSFDLTCYKCKASSKVTLGDGEHGETPYMVIIPDAICTCNICGTRNGVHGSTMYNIYEN